MATYHEFIADTYPFPCEEFKVVNNELWFNDVNVMEIIEKHGTPLRISYLPKINSQVQKAKKYFNEAFQKLDYKGDYLYTYCTKSSHFKFIVEETIKSGAHIETSSAFDMAIVEKLYRSKKINKQTFIIANGFKRPLYQKYLTEKINSGFVNCIPVLDNLNEIEYYNKNLSKDCKVGIRVATDEEPGFDFYTSRLGIRYRDVIPFYQDQISNNSKIDLKLLHFFINSGIQDNSYYWRELERFVGLYCDLKKIAPQLDTIDIGGGLPIKTSLIFDFNYKEIICSIVETIKRECDKQNVPTPNIISEFGSYTVGESGAMIYKVLDQKLQNDKELWSMIDGSFITNLPDTWAINQRFIMLAINNWSGEYQRVNLGGLTCDSKDYYNWESHSSEILLPQKHKNKEQYLGFFHTGAYQEALGGYGGVQHCLIPSAKHVILSKDQNGTLVDTVYKDEENEETMLSILGY